MSAALVSRIEIRCRGKVHGIIKEYPNGKRLFEVRCKDNYCVDRGKNEVVFHYYDMQSGKLVDTKKYRDPVRQLER
jgi:antitoxin component YwqK of YwqJK toxin-antitoxin module